MLMEPIDAVITWVDGQDVTHQAKLQQYLQHQGHMASRPSAAAPTRFNQCGELTFCVHSLLRFAPWLRRIYLVTDAQVPPIWQQLSATPAAKKLQLVDHRELFHGYEAVLPTFNSLAIESMLWRIPGLSERFIYLNDDCALLRPLMPDDFFRENKLVLRGHWKKNHNKRWGYRCQDFLRRQFGMQANGKVDDFRLLQEKTAALVGFSDKFFALPHAPTPLFKRSFQDFFAQHPEKLSQNVAFRLRDLRQFWPISLAEHLAFQQHRVVVDNSLQAIMVNGGHHHAKKILRRLAQAVQKTSVAFICMQSMDLADSATQQMMLDWLAYHIIDT